MSVVISISSLPSALLASFTVLSGISYLPVFNAVVGLDQCSKILYTSTDADILPIGNGNFGYQGRRPPNRLKAPQKLQQPSLLPCCPFQPPLPPVEIIDAEIISAIAPSITASGAAAAAHLVAAVEITTLRERIAGQERMAKERAGRAEERVEEQTARVKKQVSEWCRRTWTMIGEGRGLGGTKALVLSLCIIARANS